MAEKKASLILELKDLVSGKLKGVTDVFFGLKLGVEAFRQTFGRVIDFMMDSLRAFSESEVAVNRLNTALKNQGTFSKAYSDSLVKMASDLQRVTTFSDEAVLETQALLTTFGLAGKELENTTKAALDLSTGLGVDLKTATLLLGKAWTGETSTLSRYWLKISDTLDPAQKFAAALEQINSRFGGSAEAAVNTYAGRIANLTNKFDDLQEKIGKELLPVAEFWVKHMNSAMDSIAKWVDGEEVAATFVDKNTEALKRRIDRLKEMREALGGEGSFLNATNIEDITREINRLTASLEKAKSLGKGSAVGPAPEVALPESTRAITDEEIKAREKAWDESRANQLLKAADAAQLEAEERLAIENSANLSQLANMGLMEEAKATLRAENMALELQAMGQHEAAKLMIEEQGRKNSEAMARARMQMLMGHLATISGLANSKTKALAIVGKAAAVNMAIINTAAGVTQALKFYPPPISFVMGAAVAAAGGAQIATITGTQLGDGGMLPFVPGGHAVTFAERKSEVAIPLDDERTTEKLSRTLGPALGGSGANVTIQAGVIVADDMSLRDFAMRLDEELYRLGRARQRLSDG